ncbi:NAD-dependent epimerase/dehydratase family protein [Pseudomonas sp. M47T1]|uniref:NAD-dependent epimerase/dehydratase family protein n=1 Tax=Pseudomonas sp. M47T1 TaxID=1179778 RepID=UPI0005B809E5|nr:NAD-dependent epimerase/dehydratase family protein [Pseudomonas sp. M47T1]
MRILITGANGFLGQLLVKRLLGLASLRGQAIGTLRLLDMNLDSFTPQPRLRLHPGSVTDTALMRRVLADGIDLVFHLVSIPGGAAERQYELGYEVNLAASLELLQQLRNKACPPVLVFASSVAVYGGDLPARLDESAAPAPQLSYGAHKRMVEIALGDLARRGEVDGRALRLPGIVARPGDGQGLRSAFMSELMRHVAAGQAYQCPVSPQATAWWMSARCCVDNLLRAAELPLAVDAPRVWQLPVLHLSIAQVMEALAERFGDACRALVSYHPDPQLEAQFGRQPPLKTPQARALGLRHDGSAAALVRNALDLAPATRRIAQGNPCHEA